MLGLPKKASKDLEIFSELTTHNKTLVCGCKRDHTTVILMEEPIIFTLKNSKSSLLTCEEHVFDIGVTGHIHSIVCHKFVPQRQTVNEHCHTDSSWHL